MNKKIKIASSIMMVPALGTGIAAIVVSKSRKSTNIEVDSSFKRDVKPSSDGKATVNFKIVGLSNPASSNITIPELDERVSQGIDTEKQYKYQINSDGVTELIIDCNKIITSSDLRLSFSIHCTNSKRKFNHTIENMNVSVPATSYSVSTNYNENVIWTHLSKTIKHKNSFTANYSINEGYDVTNYDIKVNGSSIKSKSGVIFSDGKVFIPSEYVVGPISILIETQIKTFFVSSFGQNISYTCPSQINYGEDLNATYKLQSGYEITSWDILIDNKSIKDYGDVKFADEIIYIPGKYVTSNIKISAVTQKKSFWLYASGDEGFEITSEIPETFNYGDQISLTYSCSESQLLTLSKYIYLVYEEQYYSLLDYSDVIFNNGVISIPGKYTIGNIVIYGSVTNYFPVIAKGNNIFYNVPTQIEASTDFSGTYTLDPNYRIINKYIYIGDTLVYANTPKTGYEDITWDSTSITIPGKYVNGIITISATTSNKYNVTVSGKGVKYTYNSTATVGEDYSAKYALLEGYKFLSWDILVNGSSIKSKSGVVLADGKITIPKSYITGNINIIINTTDEVTVTASTDSFVSLIVPAKQKYLTDLKCTYSLTEGFFIDSYDILVDGISIKSKSDITFEDGVVFVPGKYVTGNVEIRAITYCNLVQAYANENSSFNFSTQDWSRMPDIHYSLDGKNWTKVEYSKSRVDLYKGQTLFLKGNNKDGYMKQTTYKQSLRFSGDVTLKGNIMSLLDNGTKTITAIPNKFCFYGIFDYSDGLTSVDDNFLPATELKEECYDFMFQNCKNLKKAPNLPAKDLKQGCYYCMFSGCSKLEYIEVSFETWSLNATNYWLQNVAHKGTFVCPSTLPTTSRGQSAIPEGWTVITK